MLTEVDIERIMYSQRQLADSIAEELVDREAQELLDDDELFEMLDYDSSFSETNIFM